MLWGVFLAWIKGFDYFSTFSSLFYRKHTLLFGMLCLAVICLYRALWFSHLKCFNFWLKVPLQCFWWYKWWYCAGSLSRQVLNTALPKIRFSKAFLKRKLSLCDWCLNHLRQQHSMHLLQWLKLAHMFFVCIVEFLQSSRCHTLPCVHYNELSSSRNYPLPCINVQNVQPSRIYPLHQRPLSH